MELKMDKSADLPIIALKPLEGNSPPSLNAIQRFLLPHLPLMETMLWCLWWGILAYLVVRYLVIPLAMRKSQDKA
ncbi:hypothetical protein [Bradyrhizobium roseum]|uniref:hypothetical protein n=1 Tax=Bradyrhizobium roseum TaxID=3056648 RepID=UPI0026355FD4|nr:hypothetical protein [Bradyrhizobium roseus]WKA26409.1 hypothetical protein QUH67_22750 [Bradyrhizobium roseus]